MADDCRLSSADTLGFGQNNDADSKCVLFASPDAIVVLLLSNVGLCDSDLTVAVAAAVAVAVVDGVAFAVVAEVATDDSPNQYCVCVKSEL